MAKKKTVYLELIRILAIFLVIFNHTGTNGFFLFSVRQGSALYPLYMFLSIACRTAVPLFWMVSGSLLLPKEESIRYVYRHRVLRMLLVLALFSLFQYIFTIWKCSDRFDFAYFLTKLYTDRHATAYWFLYSYIGMLMMLPFLRRMVKSMTGNQFLYLFLLIIMMKGVMPIIQYLVSTHPAVKAATNDSSLIMNEKLTSNLFSKSVLYFIGGYYFGSYLKDDALNRKHALVWAGAGIVALIISCLVTQYKINATGLTGQSDAQTFYDNLIAIPTFAIFYNIRLFFCNRTIPAAVQNVIFLAGRSAFGIMLLENALRIQLAPLLIHLQLMMPALSACLVWVAAIYLTGLLITAVLIRIPGIKKLI